MVSDSRLALIFAFLSLSIVALSAQALFLERAPALEVPSSALDGDLPTRVLLRIAVFPDSSYSLQSVEPPALKPYVSSYMWQYDLLSMLGEDAYSPGVKELEIRVQKSTKEQDPLDETAIRAGIEDWIITQREADATRLPRQDHLDPFAANAMAYGSRMNIAGLNGAPQPLILHGFELPATMMSPDIQELWLDGIYQRNADGFESIFYPYNILLTGLKAGMGEYNHRFATVRVDRNGLFGKPGFYYGLNLGMSNGWWMGSNSAITNTSQHLHFPLGKLGLDLEYSSFAQDQNSLSLHPSYWAAQPFAYERVGEYLWTRVASPWLDLSFTRRREALKASAFAIQPKNLVYQAQAAKGWQFGNFEASLAWTHAWRQQSLKLPDTAYSQEYKDLGKMNLGYQLYGFRAQAAAELTDLKNISSDMSLAYQNNNLKARLSYKSDFSPMQPNVWTDSPYTIGDSLEVYDLRQKNSGRLELGYRLGSFDLALGFGYSQYKIAFMQAGMVQEHQAQPLSAGLGAEYTHNFGFFKAILKQNLLWTQEREYMRDDPQFRGFGELELKRELEHDNAIFAALGYHFHSSYINRAIPADVLDFSLIADLRLGVQITKLFQLEAGIKNLGDNYIFGIHPIPLSMYAALSWHFLN